MIKEIQFSCGCGTEFTITRDRIMDKIYSGFSCPNCDNKFDATEKLMDAIQKLENVRREVKESDWNFHLV